MNKATRQVLGLLFSFLVFVLLGEWILNTFDPLGINRYDADLRLYFNLLIRAENGLFVLPDGIHLFSNWIAAIADGMRITETQEQDCKIAFIGDSVMFGFGINDTDVWVNLLARHYPNIEIRNYAYPGYDTSNLQAAFEQVEADGYVYFVIPNDARIGIIETRYEPPSRLWSLQRYVMVLWFAWREAQRETVVTDIYREYLEILPPNTLILGFEDETLAEYAAQNHGAVLIPMYTERISAADPHPNAVGHQQIYEAVLPHVETLIAKVC